ncbi:MAG TPA: thiol protease/hemagglutinin PrtT [Bacteroidales bacterium]|nr:thiol protease/hemagglutinin PrtT [Bacteroidales bacterium]
MKQIYALLFLLAIFTLHLSADPISVETANQVGLSFLSRPVSASGVLKSTKQPVSLKLVYTANATQVDAGNRLKSNAQTVVPFYVFNSDNQGYVVIAGDDRAVPILGYADGGAFDPNNIPPNMQKWFEGYKAEIRYAVENNITASPEIQSQWKALKSGSRLKSETSTSAIAPLIATKWNQSPYYNLQCPLDNAANERTVTGCVATAMAQVMKYWNYPAIGTGFHSYNHSTYGTLSANFGSTTYSWSDMPTQLTSSSTTPQKNAVAELMYHCGVSVDMDYGIASGGGSAAYVISSASGSTHCTEYALKTYFGYKSTLKGVQKANYTNADWITLLKSELNANRPIVYAGFGDGGHCFVCDGYDSNNFFHFNWGWGGSYDGYFALNALNPGSGGIGGGSYSYNNSQQALIGIEPATGGTTPQTYDLRLYSALSMSNTKIWFKDAFDLDVNVANYGTGSFSGQFGAAVFDTAGNFVDFIETKANLTLNANSYFSNGLTFSSSGSSTFVPGKYYAALFYKTSTQDWKIVADGNYSNLIEFEIYYAADIEVNSAFSITTDGGKLVKGNSATINVDVLNSTTNTFYGQYRVNLSNLDGSWAQNIKVLAENKGLPSNYHYPSGIDFTGTITVEPGTYLLEVAYQAQGTSDWYYAGSTNHSNPVYVIVKAPEIQSDMYEDNNTQSKAYSLPVSFSANSATKNSNGSNLHIGTDIDYYKIVLPAGNSYTITPRLHDSYSSESGQTYTVDALFSYSTNGTSYSETYDDVMQGNITVNNGGTVYFKVAPYFSGNTGTYLLDLSITRGAITAINEVETDAQISLFPNPAIDFVTIDLQQTTNTVNLVVLCDFHGAQLYTEDVTNATGIIRLPLANIPSGVYFVQIHTNKGILTKKLVVKK